jgi:hypothetical protein
LQRKYSEKNLLQQHLAHHASHMDSLVLNLGLRSEKLVTNPMSYGAARMKDISRFSID